LRRETGKALYVDRTQGCREPEMTGPEAQRHRSCSTPVVVADAQHLLRATFRRYRPLTASFDQLIEINMEQVSFCIGTAFAQGGPEDKITGSPA